MIELSITDAELIAFQLAKELLDDIEPMPPFDSRPRHRLEGVLTAPFASFEGQEQYPTLAEKAAVLFYHCCKDHPLQNGNKRMAVVLMTVFLALNDYWPDLSTYGLYGVATAVAKSEPGDREEVIAGLTEFIGDSLITYEEAEQKFERDDQVAKKAA